MPSRKKIKRVFSLTHTRAQGLARTFNRCASWTAQRMRIKKILLQAGNKPTIRSPIATVAPATRIPGTWKDGVGFKSSFVFDIYIGKPHIHFVNSDSFKSY